MHLYRQTLRNSGHDIIMSANSDEACNIARKYDPDMILLDIMIPSEKGFNIFEDLKSGNDRCSNVPIIFTSAIDVNIVVEKTGVSKDYIMRKPINFGELNGLVKKIQNNIKLAIC
jgi:DNA-binding response OmpR family regulator